MKFINTITARFTVWYLVVLFVLLLALSAGVYFNLSRTLHDELDEGLKARAAQLTSIRDLIGIVDHGRFEENLGEVVVFYYHSGSRLEHLSPRNQTLPVSEAFIDRVIGGQSALVTRKTQTGTKLRIFAVPYRPQADDRLPPPPPLGAPPPPLPGEHPMFPNMSSRAKPGEVEGSLALPPRPEQRGQLPPYYNPDRGMAALVIAQPMTPIEQALSGLLMTLVFAVPLTLLISGAGGIFLARRVLNPIERITATAESIGESDLSKRIDVHTNDELGHLSKTLNEMIERLERAFERQRQFTGDASHELRTPLSVIEAESTLALKKDRTADEYKRSLVTVAEEAEHMAAIIDQLLKLARTDAGKETLNVKDVYVDKLIETVTSRLGKRCEEKGVAIESNLDRGVMLKGDEAMLRLMISNLVENAIRYTSSGGTVTVALKREKNAAIIEVKDTGIGIPESDLAHIFDRFYRVDKARSRAEGGSGLGLAICKQIVELHGGAIHAKSQVGRGSTFTVKLGY